MIGLESYSGRRKAAALLIALGPEISSGVLRHLREDQIDQVTQEIVRMERMPGEMRDQILQNCYEEAMTRQYITEGGSEYAQQLLARTLGTAKAQEVLTRATVGTRGHPFDFVRQVDLQQLVTALEAEHPQTIALVLSHFQPDLAGRVLSALDYELQADVASRVALMGRTAPEVTKEVETVLKKKLAAFQTHGFRAAGGVDHLVKVLNGMDTRSERAILESIEHSDPELAAEIRSRMFVFEDLILLDDRSIQRVMRDVNMKDIAMALKGASEDVKSKIYKNLSSRAANQLRDDIGVLGQVRLRLVEEAQQRIINTIRTLQEAEEITISRGREDVFV